MTSAPSPTNSSLLYKYVSIVGLRRVLEGSIRFTQPSAFNDPFELLPEIITRVEEHKRQIQLSFDIRADRQLPAGEPSEPIPDGCSTSDVMSRDIVQQLNQVIGILSLSRENSSLLMWSHYADQYSGAVVAFDGSHEFLSDQVDVEYRSTRPRRHISSYLCGKPVPVAELCAKSDHWAYEREVRVIRLMRNYRLLYT
jgi:hypothetical protein